MASTDAFAYLHRVAVAAAFMAIGGLAPAAVVPPALEECDRLLRKAPDDPDSYYCYARAARDPARRREAARRLESILALHPDRHRARLNLAVIEEAKAPDRAESLYREAARGFEDLGDRKGVVHARLSLASLLARLERRDEATAQIEEAGRAAEVEGDSILIARVRSARGFQAFREADYGLAARLLRQAEAAAFPGGPPDLLASILSGLGAVHWATGDHRRAMEAYGREVDLRARAGAVMEEGVARYNVALMAGRLLEQGEMEPREYERLIEEALEAAVRGGNRRAEAEVRLLLGQQRRGPAAIAEFQKALALTGADRHPQTRRLVLRLLAGEMSHQGPEGQAEALRLVGQAIEEARSAGSYQDIARGMIVRAGVVWHAAPREDAIRAYGAALEAVERLRDLQPEGTVRTRVFSQWTFVYYRMSGRLLGTLAESDDPDRDLDLAFRTTERMRARSLLETLDAAGAVKARAGDPLHDRRNETLRRISAMQSRLTSSSLTARQRGEAISELDRLEDQEAALRDEMVRTDPPFAVLRSPDLPGIRRIQEALEEDEALLSFQIWEQGDRAAVRTEAGGSWVIAISRQGARAHSTPPRRTIEEQVRILRGLLVSPGGADPRASTRLFRDLLEEALSALPATIAKLVIVPDAGLHSLPFAALVDPSSGEPLASRFEISHAPSATVWLRLRRRGVLPDNRQVLSLADPAETEVVPPTPTTARAPWADGSPPLPLAGARREAAALVRALGRGTLRTGPEASELFLKGADLGPYAVIHFATHAIVDDRRPERSAILLARGAPDEDGLLQVREILDLDLRGKVIVLSACRTANGAVLEGEGVVGLSRAFFQAGAEAVVGSLWPVLDTDAETMTVAMSRHLGERRSLGAALAAAQRSLSEQGAPARAWAGLIVLGDAQLALTPVAATWSPRVAAYVLAIAAVVLAGGLALLRPLRRAAR